MKILVLLLLELISSQYCSCSLFECELTVPAIRPSLFEIGEIKRYLESQQFEPKLAEDVTETELETFKQANKHKSGADNEDKYLNITELIHKYGFHSEEHHVTTEDGYILAIFRIPGKRPPVLLNHGFTMSSDDFVLMGPEGSTAYELASKGYDVWMGNARGNKHSRKHKTLSPDCADFWDFTLDEIGRYDLPAMIDYVLQLTCQPKLFYVGFSQGTTAFFILASERPEYNEKISLMVALSPVAFLHHAKSPLLRLLSLGSDMARQVVDAIGQHEILSQNILTEIAASVFCGDNVIAETMCSNIMFLLCGFDVGQLNVTTMPVMFSHAPAGVSTKQFLHGAQILESAKFRRYNYGEKGNKEMYGCDTPPDYPLEKITAPVALFYSNNDWLSDIADVRILYDRCPNIVDCHFIEKYCHISYIYAITVKERVTKRILELFNMYS